MTEPIKEKKDPLTRWSEGHDRREKTRKKAFTFCAYASLVTGIVTVILIIASYLNYTRESATDFITFLGDWPLLVSSLGMAAGVFGLFSDSRKIAIAGLAIIFLTDVPLVGIMIQAAL